MSLTGKLLKLNDELEKEIAAANQAATRASAARAATTSEAVKQTYDRRVLEYETRAQTLQSVKSRIVKAVQ